MGLIRFHLVLTLFSVWLISPPTSIGSSTSGLDPIVGHPYITTFLPAEYKAHKQNWGVVQDSFGILYFANGNGVLIYNGTDWQLVELPDKSMVSSIAIDEVSQEIFVGGWGTFGSLKFDTIGRPYYNSLSSQLGPDADKVTRVFETIATTDGVYFQTMEAVYRYRVSDGIHEWNMGPKQLGKLFFVNNRLLLKWHYKGIYELIEDTWMLLTDSEQFGGVFVSSIVPFGRENLLFGLGTSLLYLYDGHKFVPFASQISAYLEEHRLYCAIQTIDSNYVFGTVTGGVVGMDHTGRINLKINDVRYIQSLNIRNFLLDQDQNLVVAMDVGIAFIELYSPYTIFEIEQEEIEVNAFAQLGNQLFAGTERGLLELSHNSDGQQVFEEVPDFGQKIWSLLSMDDRLIVADEYGIHEMKGDHKKNTILKGLTPGAQRSSINPKRVYVFHSNGMSSMRLEKGIWHQDTIMPAFNRRVRKVIEVSEQEVWLDTDWTELWKVSFAGDSGTYYWSDPKLTKYDTSSGLPDERGNLYDLAGSLYFVPRTNSHNYVWKEDEDRFEIDSQLHQILKIQARDAVLWDIDHQKNCWYVTNYGDEGEHLGRSILNQRGEYQESDIQCDRILDDIGTAVLIDQDTIWYGGFSSIVKQRVNVSWRAPKYTVTISKVMYQTDSILSFGMYNRSKPRLKYKHNAIDFQYGIAPTDLTKSIHFQTFLGGYDTDWSSWTKEKHRQYFGLSPGQYEFQVRALDSESQVSAPMAYSFSVLSPWYRKWWMIVVFLSGFIATIAGLGRWRNRELLRRNSALEELIRERTQEVEERNKQLSDQSKRLHQLDQMKTNLFANISHEFRTPLTLIKAPIELMKMEPERSITTEDAGMIERNADRLLRLVNQLLDLAKLDASSLQLELSEGDVFRFMRLEVSSFGSLAAQCDIDFRIEIPSRKLWANFDRGKWETIIYNLLNNAFKFTPSKGTIEFIVNHNNDEMVLQVSDSGPGIPNEDLSRIFDRFYQVKNSDKVSNGGAGIGLTICQELVILMGGDITVTSTLGLGAKFCLRLPVVPILDSSELDFDALELLSRPGKGHAEDRSDQIDIILIVEDHAEMRKYIRSILESQYQIIEAENGAQGLEIAIREIPDLIITDTMMPSMDGHAYSKAIKSDPNTSHIPIIMLTAKASLENKLVGLDAGVDSYLTKPFNILELEASIKSLLLERKRLRNLFAKQLLVTPRQIAMTSLDQHFLERVNSLLESKYSDSAFGVPQMQVALVMSKTQLHRKLTAIANQPPGEFLRNFRLQRAAQILLQKGETVTQVAYLVGFENVPYFTKCFKTLFGVNPSKYGNDLTGETMIDLS